MSRLRSILFPPPNHANTDNPLGSAFALTVVAVFVQGLSRFGYSVLVGNLLGQEALAEVSGDSERDTARALVRRKLRSLGSLDDAVKVRRLVGMLARKGYSPGMAYEVVREELAASGAEAELLGYDHLD